MLSYSGVAYWRENPPEPVAFYDEWKRNQPTCSVERAVRERYPDDGDQRMALSNAFVASHPTIRRQLEDSGVGSDPALVLALADRAYNLRPKRK